jgi:20S proteasome subunit alpha 2
LIAGYDESGPHLTQIDPSGAYYNWKATAIGKNAKNAKVFLEKRYKADMEIEDAIHTALMTLKEGFEGEMSNTNIEVGVVREDRKFQVLTPTQIKEYLDELN